MAPCIQKAYYLVAHSESRRPSLSAPEMPIAQGNTERVIKKRDLTSEVATVVFRPPDFFYIFVTLLALFICKKSIT